MPKYRSGGESIDYVFRALADPSRRVIVERLSRGPASVSELARPLPMSLPAVLQHVQVLEASGLVRSEKIGRVRTCEIEPAALRRVEQWISARRSNWERRLDRLGDVLRRRLTDAGLKDVRVERTADRPAFASGQEMWDWVLYGNPIPDMLVADLSEEQQTRLRQVLDGMLRERAPERTGEPSSRTRSTSPSG